ncbi:MAG: hypothetical protein LBV31_04075, partial [Prevotellaceae bacterium]|nr:hypothetical protein [Prevotellaceae bacterium]
MINYLLLLNNHRNLSSKRKSDYKHSLITALMLGFAVALPVSLVLDKASKEDIESLAIFVFPMIIILDFSLRFFLKSNASAPVFPY